MKFCNKTLTRYFEELLMARHLKNVNLLYDNTSFYYARQGSGARQVNKN